MQKDFDMKKLLLAATALVALGSALPAFAEDTTNKTAVGAAAGATTGGTLGFLLGGPIGAIIGGFSGALIGGQISDTTVTYVGTHPVEQVYLDDNVDVGFKVGSSVKLYPVEGDDAHSYFYANNRVWIVDSSTGEVVASPGYVVPETAVTYVKAHPTASVSISGDVAPGFTLDSGVTYADIPDAHGYGYVYINDRPAQVDTRSRVVVWID